MSLKHYRAGFVALLGEPNAGKSTLMNAVLKEKVSIVSEKPQTTRGRIHGIHSDPGRQIVFVDAPGVVTQTAGLNAFLREEVTSVLAHSDAVLLVISAKDSEETVARLIQRVLDSGKPWAAVITKRDLLKEGLSPASALLRQQSVERQVRFEVITALKRGSEAREIVLDLVTELLPTAEAPLFDEELLTTEPVRKLAAEFVREACFRHTRQEVPYGLAVRVARYDESGQLPKIYCDILVDREGHKGILIGAKGANLKRIGSEARAEIERLVGGKVYLELHVDVREGWTKNPGLMKELGYVIVRE